MTVAWQNETGKDIMLKVTDNTYIIHLYREFGNLGWWQDNGGFQTKTQKHTGCIQKLKYALLKHNSAKWDHK